MLPNLAATSRRPLWPLRYLRQTMRKPAAAMIGIVVAAIAVRVVVGMIGGADPNFSKGRSTTASVVTQEVVGAMAVVALFGAVIGCISVARGHHVRRLSIRCRLGSCWSPVGCSPTPPSQLARRTAAR